MHFYVYQRTVLCAVRHYRFVAGLVGVRASAPLGAALQGWLTLLLKRAQFPAVSPEGDAAEN